MLSLPSDLICFFCIVLEDDRFVTVLRKPCLRQVRIHKLQVLTAALSSPGRMAWRLIPTTCHQHHTIRNMSLASADLGGSAGYMASCSDKAATCKMQQQTTIIQRRREIDSAMWKALTTCRQTVLCTKDGLPTNHMGELTILCISEIFSCLMSDCCTVLFI